MAINFGNRKDSEYKVICLLPSFEWTKGIPLPVPYPVHCHLGESEDVSEDVFYNGDNSFTQISTTTYVEMDKPALDVGAGVISGTKEEEATPLQYCDSVRVNGNGAVRAYHMFYMNKKNTIGILIKEPKIKAPITDTGKSADAIEAPEVPSFMEFF